MLKSSFLQYNSYLFLLCTETVYLIQEKGLFCQWRSWNMELPIWLQQKYFSKYVPTKSLYLFKIDSLKSLQFFKYRLIFAKLVISNWNSYLYLKKNNESTELEFQYQIQFSVIHRTSLSFREMGTPLQGILPPH